MAGDALGADQGPAWFRFGRALLVVAASTALPDSAEGEADASVSTAAETVDRTRRQFNESLTGDNAFAVLVANAQLSDAEAEVLALLATAEVDASCRQLVAAIQGDARAGQLTLGSLAVVMPNGHPGALTVASSGRLRRTGFVEVGRDGPWADRLVALDEAVVWTLLGDESPEPSLPVGIELIVIGKPQTVVDRVINTVAVITQVCIVTNAITIRIG